MHCSKINMLKILQAIMTQIKMRKSRGIGNAFGNAASLVVRESNFLQRDAGVDKIRGYTQRQVARHIEIEEFRGMTVQG